MRYVVYFIFMIAVVCLCLISAGCSEVTKPVVCDCLVFVDEYDGTITKCWNPELEEGLTTTTLCIPCPHKD